MTTQPEAMRLAELIDWPSVDHGHKAAAELRRLYATNKELLEALKKLLRDADSEPDGEYLQGANKGCVAVHRSGIERARAAITKAEGRA